MSDTADTPNLASQLPRSPLLRLVRWFFRQFTDYRWARRKLGGKWQKWVPENGKNKGFWVEGRIIPDEIADILKVHGWAAQYVATPEVEIYPANAIGEARADNAAPHPPKTL
jgi:hypothetical protein